MVLKQREIMFVGDSEQADYPNFYGTHRNVCLAELRRQGYPCKSVGPHDDGATAYPARLHRGNIGEQAFTVSNALSTFATELTTYFTGTVGSRARPVVVMNWGVNDIGHPAANKSAAQVYSYNALIAAQIFASIPDVILIVRKLIKPGAGAVANYGTNNAVCDTYNAGLATQAALWGAHGISDPGAPELRAADLIHPAETYLGYGAVGLADVAAIVATGLL